MSRREQAFDLFLGKVREAFNDGFDDGFSGIDSTRNLYKHLEDGHRMGIQYHVYMQGWSFGRTAPPEKPHTPKDGKRKLRV